jgi:hypothetical protein
MRIATTIAMTVAIAIGLSRCYDSFMHPDHLRAFALRPWAEIEEAKSRYWIARKAELSPAEALAVAEALRVHARALRPDWPSPAERAADLEAHARVAADLRRVR